MEMNSKQIYVSLQLDSNELKLLVGEYFNTRFNIIRLERLETTAINDFKINDKNKLVEDIKKLVNETSSKIGARIEEAILVIPAYNFKRIAIKSTVVPETGYLTKKDVARAISNSLSANVDRDIMVINSMISKYTINGISTRRFPENEACDEAIVDIDLLCADKEMTYSYVSAVESAGIRVLDICLNNYALAKEAALFEESLKKNLVVLDINRDATYLSLLSKGKLVSTEIVYDGLESIIQKVYYKYHIPKKDIAKLIKYNINYNTQFKNDIVYAFSEQGESKSITAAELNECIEEPIGLLVNKLINMCNPIVEQGGELIITGEGEQMAKLIDLIKANNSGPVRTYYPDTIGVRDPSLVALYGTFFAYRDKVLMNDLNVSCIDVIQYESNIEHKEFDTEGETITTKIKNLFKQYIDKGEE